MTVVCTISDGDAMASMHATMPLIAGCALTILASVVVTAKFLPLLLVGWTPVVGMAYYGMLHYRAYRSSKANRV